VKASDYLNSFRVFLHSRALFSNFAHYSFVKEQWNYKNQIRHSSWSLLSLNILKY